MQEQAGKENQGKIADCGCQSGDSKIGTSETQTGNLSVAMNVRFRWWWGLLVLGVGLLMVASFYFDGAVQAWIAQHQNDGVRKFMRGVGQVGDWPGHITLGLVLLVLAYWRRSKKWMRIFAAMILACVLAGAGARVVKIAVGRARPSVKTDFPSGHTAASTAFFATLALACWRIGLPFLVIPLLIAFSRMYGSAHFLSDVVCASLIGLVSAYLVARWLLPPIGNRKSEI
jgi:membrane-associated phospholipid phosphatase